jgi:ubiquinone biosynthesis protein UbiJ
MADKVVRLNIRAFIHKARQAAVWKIAIRDICKAIEQLDDQIADLVTRVKKLEVKS